MSSESSSIEETSHIAPAPGSSVIEGSIEENPIPQYPPFPCPPTCEELRETDYATFEASLDALPEEVGGELEEQPNHLSLFPNNH